MRWTTATVGDTRTVVRFAWIPTRCAGGTTVWLESVVLHQTLDRDELFGSAWVTKSATVVEDE